ncbi:MAG: SH3 domain-containing protein, partial [Spirochaetales bacterium]|nr:SH3 domain-containing protein [Spirochaetales bacterium]
IGKLNNIFYFYNSLYIASYASNEDYIFYNTYLVNEETGELTKLLEYTKVYDISPDKMNLLVVSYNENYIGIYNIEKKEVVKKIKFSGDPAFDDSLYFIDNDNFFLLSCETGQEIGHIMNLNMETLIDIHYLKPTDVPNIGLSLSTIMKAHYGYYTQGGGKRILVKMPGEQEIYEENNLFFHPTTATLNDDRVRMREWPLLDAKHIAFLEKGEKVEVLDRSGIRVKIGDMNDYWYKLRRSDGTEGWSYGYFLDLAAE